MEIEESQSVAVQSAKNAAQAIRERLVSRQEEIDREVMEENTVLTQFTTENVEDVEKAIATQVIWDL